MLEQFIEIESPIQSLLVAKDASDYNITHLCLNSNKWMYIKKLAKVFSYYNSIIVKMLAQLYPIMYYVLLGAPLSCIDLLARLFPASTSPLRRFQVDSPQQSYKYIEQYSKALETRANLLHNTGASTKREKSQHLHLQHSDASQHNTKERETEETC